MSDKMLHAVLNMPVDCWSDYPVDTAQRHARYVQASKRIHQLEEKVERLQKDMKEKADNLAKVRERVVAASNLEHLNLRYLSMKEARAAQTFAFKVIKVIDSLSGGDS